MSFNLESKKLVVISNAGQEIAAQQKCREFFLKKHQGCPVSKQVSSRFLPAFKGERKKKRSIILNWKHSKMLH